MIMSSFPIVSSHLQWLSTDSLSVKYVWVKFVERVFAKVGRVSCLICEKKFLVDPGRIRTCNPLIRSQMPYPLGHAAVDMRCGANSLYTSNKESGVVGAPKCQGGGEVSAQLT